RTAPDAFALPRVESAGLDGTVVLFAVGVTVLTGLLFGVLPALQAARTAPARALRSEGRGASSSGGRVRNGLVVAEVALSLVLLVAAGLLARSFARLVAVDPGIDPENVVAARVALQGPAYDGQEPDVRFFTSLVDELRGSPGVEAAGGITFLPFTDLASATSYQVADQPVPDPEDMPVTEVRNVVGSYFESVGMRLLEGRLLDDRDRADGRDVVVVSRALAEAHWPGESAIGKRVLLQWAEQEDLEIVGVVEDARHYGLDVDPRPTLFLPYAQQPYFPFMYVTVRSASLTVAQVTRVLEEAVGRLDPAVPVSEVRVMRDVVAESVARPRMTAFLMGVLAALAATLAAVGLYGVLSYTVSRRVREIGVRVALGAEPGRVLGLVVGEGMLLVGGGVVLGVGASLLLGDVVEALLYGVAPTDPVSLVGASLLLVTVGLVACLLPAYRATRVEPSEALRSE
ncbi:MAG: ABC transporter permease, partial [Gemmatimonadota bacterium]